MKSPIGKLKITISRTADGKSDYVQILSGDQFSLNIVLIADCVDVLDARTTGEDSGNGGRA